jgi:nitrous oxide reductase accessory protein NosL
MKNAIIIGVIAGTILMAGCGKESPSSKPVALSDGSNTWHLGAMTISGTNVPATNITIGVRTSEVSK